MDVLGFPLPSLSSKLGMLTWQYKAMLFFTGWHQPVNGPSGCQDFDYCMISINRLIDRKSNFAVKNWILDSGAYTRISKDKKHLSTRKYAGLIERWARCGNLMAAAAQDYICDSSVLDVTGLTVEQHQKATIARYKHLKRINQSGVYIMPVLQGSKVDEYLVHIDMYGDLLTHGMWVGVGSLCKNSSRPSVIENILLAIKQKRPDLRLHGFGIKKKALSSGLVNHLLYSADSQSASFESQSKFSRHQNNPKTAIKYKEKIMSQPLQQSIFQLLA